MARPSPPVLPWRELRGRLRRRAKHVAV